MGHNNTKSCVILVATNDDYYRAFAQIWMSCLKYFWSDCKHQILFSTPTAKIDNIPTFNSKTGSGWNRSTLAAMNFIQEKYNPYAVLLLHEDFLIGPESRAGAYTEYIERCIQILQDHKEVRTIGLVRKDPESGDCEYWPDMLGWQNILPGVLPVDPAGITLWRTVDLKQHLMEVIAEMPPEKDPGRQGVVEFSYYGAEWARARNEKHLRVKRGIDYKDGVLNILFGVTIEQGKLKIRDSAQLALVEDAVGKKLEDLDEVKPLLEGKELNLLS